MQTQHSLLLLLRLKESNWTSDLSAGNAMEMQEVLRLADVQNLVSHPEEFFGGAGVQCPIGDLRLLGQILSTLYRGDHPLHCQEGSQVGSVG